MDVSFKTIVAKNSKYRTNIFFISLFNNYKFAISFKDRTSQNQKNCVYSSTYVIAVWVCNKYRLSKISIGADIDLSLCLARCPAYLFMCSRWIILPFNSKRAKLLMQFMCYSETFVGLLLISKKSCHGIEGDKKYSYSLWNQLGTLEAKTHLAK